MGTSATSDAGARTRGAIDPAALVAARVVRHKVESAGSTARRRVATLLGYLGDRDDPAAARAEFAVALRRIGIETEPDLTAADGDDFVVLRARERRRADARRESRRPERGDDVPDLVEELQPAIVHIESRDGSGSGFGIRSEGFVVTNAHVLGEGEHRVRSAHRPEVVAETVGVDESTDLAVLRLEVERLPSLEFRALKTLRLGETVLALGSPFGLEWSVTIGIVSGLDRTLTAPDGQRIDYAIQTDAQINPGNSGGPLVTRDGHVVGVNAQARAGAGLGFAIPSDTAAVVTEELLAHGAVVRGTIGVRVAPRPFFGEEADRYGQDGGALVTRVRPEGPAAAAGVREGDVLISFDGQLVDEPGDLFRLLGRQRVERECPVRLIRDGELVETEIVPTRRGDGG